MRPNTRVSGQWTLLQNDINTLAGYYGMTANWDTRRRRRMEQ